MNNPEKLTKLENLSVCIKTAEIRLKQLQENANKIIVQGHIKLDDGIDDTSEF